MLLELEHNLQKAGTSNAAGTQASQASKGGTSNAAARPIIKSEAFQTGVVLGVANQKTWAAIVEKLRKRPSKH
ncbi:hypothetical protein Tco_1076947 [Tanacetum coccineum]